MAKGEINASSLLSGIAIGAVVTMLASIAIVPGGGGGGGGGGTTRLVGSGGGAAAPVIDDAVLESVESTLSEGEAVAVDESTGAVVVVDESTGEVLREVPTDATGGAAVGEAGAADPGAGSGGGTDGTAGGKSGSGVSLGDGSGGSGSGSGSGAAGGGGGGACSGNGNGGATDVGVTGNEVKLGATVAEDGIAKSFLGEVRQAMEAMKNKVNRSGGVCGRQLKIVYKNDGWDANRGATFIQNLVEGEKVFALAVSPSSEGLNQASNQGYFKSKGVPVVGADGLNATQFKDPMIWPVAAATTTTIDIMMKNAWDRGARNPAIVFGNTYRFGVEGAYAFNQAFKKLSGKDVPGYKNPLTAGGGGCDKRFCGVSAGQGQYGNQVSAVKSACDAAPGCDFMVLLLEPKTALDWMSVPGVKQPSDFKHGISGPQPLFTYDFGRQCSDKCNGMRLWTGYNPPIEQYRSSAAVSQFVSDLKAQSSSADEYNQFTMGGYVGMQVLVEALKVAGPNLTRKGLADAMNSMAAVNTGLTQPLKWTASARYANASAQAFEIQARQGFTGWRFVQAPMKDPWLGQHAG